jgi:hypothetical protein
MGNALQARITMSIISETAENEIKALLASWWTAINQQLAAATGNEIQIGKDVPLELLFASEIGQCLVRIAEAAENQMPWSPDTAQAVLADCDVFEAWLNQTPVAHRTPEEFWNTPIGYLVLQARLWADQDQLISLKDAAELSGLSLSSLSQRISRGQMKSYRDPHEPNPQRARRIRLTDLDQFIREGILRKPGTTTLSRLSLPIRSISQSQFQYHPVSSSAEQNQP